MSRAVPSPACYEDRMATTHRYRVTLAWSGSTGVGYQAYDRRHAGATVPPSVAVALSADPAFRGDTSGLNPEQLVVLAASSCQLLSFLAVAAKARIDVVGYEDDAEGVMAEDDPPLRLVRIDLRPVITLAAPAAAGRVERLVGLAHDECYVANSLRTEIVVTPTVLTAPRA